MVFDGSAFGCVICDGIERVMTREGGYAQKGVVDGVLY